MPNKERLEGRGTGPQEHPPSHCARQEDSCPAALVEPSVELVEKGESRHARLVRRSAAGDLPLSVGSDVASDEPERC